MLLYRPAWEAGQRRGTNAKDFEKCGGLCQTCGCCYPAPSGDFGACVGWDQIYFDGEPHFLGTYNIGYFSLMVDI